jgi:periplasmic divalent cation tolerance protein
MQANNPRFTGSAGSAVDFTRLSCPIPLLISRGESSFVHYIGRMQNTDPNTPCLVYISTGSGSEAEAIAAALIEERLAACCSVLSNVHSFYRWENALQNDEECLLLCKTMAGRFEDLQNRVLELHSYDVPEIIMTPIAGGSPEYLQWLGESVTRTQNG